MGWPSSIVGIAVYCVVLPCAFVANVLAAVLAPLIHLLVFSWHGVLVPLGLLGRLETLYVFLGVAAVVGLLSGSILHVLARALVAVLDRRPRRARAAAPARAPRDDESEPPDDDAWRALASVDGGGRREARLGRALDREYGEFLRRRREWHGLLSQTIVEEDDDS